MKTRKNNPKAEAREVIAAASKTQLTIAGDAAMRYIIMFAGLVLAELEEAKKHLPGISRQQIVDESLAYIRKEKGEASYPSDRALLSDYYHTIRDYAWSTANRREAEYIIRNLKRSEAFCKSFFYSRSVKADNINMGPIVSKIVYELKGSHNIAIDEREVASIIYAFFWDEGKWSKLDGFRFESSFFCWLETISRREVVKHFEKLGYIKVVHKQKTSDNPRANRYITVSAEAAMDIIRWLEYKTGDSSLLDIFGINLSDNEIEDCALNVISAVSAGIPWRERDRYIFYGRYFEDASPVEMAHELGVSRGYIDTRFSRLQERFNKALRQWAVDMKLLTKQDVAAIERRIKERKEKERAKRAQERTLRNNRKTNNIAAL